LVSFFEARKFIGADVDIRDVNRGLRKVAEFGGNPRLILLPLRKPLRADQRAHAKAQEGSGGKWRPRAASTVEAIKGRRRAARRARKAGERTRKSKRSMSPRILGRLPGAIDVKVEGRALVARSKVDWSLAQQDGGRVGRRRRTRIPGREFLWISDRMLDTAADDTADALATSFGEGP
jgi:phage gpG-like protein